MELFLSLLYVTALCGASMAGIIRIRTEKERARLSGEIKQYRQCFPWTTLLITVAIGLPTTLQFFFPRILLMLRRDAAAFWAGEWWRVITPLFVQDGGVTGSVFNLVSLLVVGSIAEFLWGSRRWLILFFLGGVASEAVSLAWQPIGAGNSVANFCLAASVAVVCLAYKPLRLERLGAGLTLGAGLWLLVLRNNHGAAIAVGAIIGWVLIRFEHHPIQKGMSTGGP
jgi:membrane associated rhomboid family serine protease